MVIKDCFFLEIKSKEFGNKTLKGTNKLNRTKFYDKVNVLSKKGFNFSNCYFSIFVEVEFLESLINKFET